MKNQVVFKRKYFVDYLFSSGGLIILFLFVGKLYYLNEIPLQLSYDESYYWDWSRKLDFGYYSKPPMVAWLIYLSTKIMGNSEQAVRLPALLSNTFFISILYVLACKYLNFSLGRLILATSAFTPIFFAYSFVMTIDPPLIFFWTLAFYFFVSYIFSPKTLFAVLTGISLGLGLLTKQTMFLFYLLVFSYFFFLDRSYLKYWQTYFILFLPLIIYSPNLYWNIKYGFLMFQHTTEHFVRTGPDIQYILNFYGGLFLLYGPFFVFLFFFLGFKFFKFTISKVISQGIAFFEADQTLHFLFLSFLFSFFPFMLLLPFTFFKKFNLNWIIPLFITSFFWISAIAIQKRLHKFFLYLNLFIGIFLVLLMLGSVKNPDLIEVKGRKPVKELLSKFIGWKELAYAVSECRSDNQPLVTNHREIASSLAFYMSGHPEVCVLPFGGRITNQYHLWYDCNRLRGAEVLYVQKGQGEPWFLKDPLLLRELRIDLNGKAKIYQVWRGELVEIP